jgi:hypothetical protein
MMGRTIVHGSGEGMVWPTRAPWQAKPVGTGGLCPSPGPHFGIAVFLVAARVARRLLPGDRDDVDIAGLRIGLGRRGSVPADFGHGLIHDHNTLSFGFEF